MNDFVNAFSISGKAQSLEDTIGVASNKVVMTHCTGSSHWVLCVSTFDNDIPKFVIADGVRCVGRDWHTSEGSKSFTWSSTVDLGVVNIEFRESLLKED